MIIPQAGGGNIEALRAAVYGHTMEHGVAPHFILMSTDLAQSIFHEAQTNAKWAGIVKVGATPSSPMRFDLGTGPIEIGQLVGNGRLELVVDYALAKAQKVGRS